VAELRKRFDDSFQLANQKESLLHEHADSVKASHRLATAALSPLRRRSWSWTL